MSEVLDMQLASVWRVGSETPAAYRLARTAGGGLVLQGRFDWHEVSATGITTGVGHDWRSLPTVDLE